MPEYIRYLLRLVLWVVALMTGVLSIMRELLGIYRPDEYQTRSLFWNCVIIAFIISAAILWFIEHQKAANLEKQLEREKSNKEPKLTAEFNVLATSPVGKHDESSVIIIMATITNIGAPSIISNVQVIIKKGNMEIHGENLVLGQGPMFLEGEDLKLLLKEEDNLPKKGISSPIPTGGALHGWHIVLAQNIQKQEIYNQDITIVFTYQDVTGKLYITEKRMDKAVSKLIDATKLQKLER